MVLTVIYIVAILMVVLYIVAYFNKDYKKTIYGIINTIYFLTLLMAIRHSWVYNERMDLIDNHKNIEDYWSHDKMVLHFWNSDIEKMKGE